LNRISVRKVFFSLDMVMTPLIIIY
jgi:hypothetical protein